MGWEGFQERQPPMIHSYGAYGQGPPCDSKLNRKAPPECFSRNEMKIRTEGAANGDRKAHLNYSGC
jgi:hypothetical protein